MTTKLTQAQVAVLNNGERNTTYPGKVWMSPWNDKTIAILKGHGLIEQHLILEPGSEDRAAVIRQLDSLADKIKTAITNETWDLCRQYGYKVTELSGRLTTSGWFLTEAGRQALVASNGGA